MQLSKDIHTFSSAGEGALFNPSCVWLLHLAVVSKERLDDLHGMIQQACGNRGSAKGIRFTQT